MLILLIGKQKSEVNMKDKKFLIDSNIIIYHLNGDCIATNFLSKHLNVCCISQLTYIEVLSFTFTIEQERIVKKLLDTFTIIDITKHVSLQAVENRKIKKIKIADNIIASTAQVYELILVTRNVSDFKLLPIEILNIFD